MSFASETAGDAGSLGDAAREGNSSRASSGGSQQDGDLGDGSESETYVEVEQLSEDAASEPPALASSAVATSPAPSPPCNNYNVVRHVTKRTLITLQQRSVLEEFYRNGMTSASQQLAAVHEAVAAKTGLDLSVVRNWIRNRRRPNAAKMAEKMAEKIVAFNGAITSSLPSTQLPTLIPSNPTSLTPLPTLPHTVVVTATNHHNLMTPGLIRVTDAMAHHPTMAFSSIPHLSVPEPKRVCLDQNTHNHTSSPTSSTPYSSPLLVKVRVSGSGESDFVEVELATPTYHTLVSACCEELEVSLSEVAKIRKLPNVLVRKDRDVQRMTDGQELELVLKGEISSGPGGVMSVISPPAAAAAYPTTSMLTVNPFASPNAAMLALSNQVQRASPVAATATNEGLVSLKGDENGTNASNHISGMTGDSGEMQNHTHNHAHSTPVTINGLQ